jgi:3-hydroxyisobutyrate dehydrogenase-like beta-hydroxyacid dehydrogenase
MSESCASLAAASDVVIVCLFSQEQVEQVCLGPNGVLAHLQPGGVLISHTSAEPASAQRLVDTALTRGVAVIDAPLDGLPTDLESGACNIVAGGSAEAMEVAMPIMKEYGSPIFHVGGPVAGQRMKMIQSFSVAANFGIVENAQLLAERLGLDVEQTFRVLNAGTATNSFMDIALALSPQDPAAFVDRQRRFLVNYWDMYGDAGYQLGAVGDFEYSKGWEPPDRAFGGHRYCRRGPVAAGVGATGPRRSSSTGSA